MSRIKVIHEHEAEGRLKEIYDHLLKKRGKVAEVHKIQSLHPESVMKHMDLYMEIMFSKSPLSRAEREMIAVVVSAANGCEYCQEHHGQALLHYWKDEQKVKQLQTDYRKLNLSEREEALCTFAVELTEEPDRFEDYDGTPDLRNRGLDDRAILDATLVISYFNFVNRIVLSMGVPLEEDKGAGYKY